MDEKIGWTAALLVGMLVVVGALGFMGGMVANEAPENTDEDDQESQDPVETDDAPLLTMDDAIHAYGVTAFTIEGGIHDESPSTTVVHVEIINPIDDTDRQGPWMFFAGSDGRWSGVLPITMPGEWVTSAYAEDAGGQTSATVYASAVMPLPEEPAAEFTTSFALNSANSDWADITGTISHTFPSTCDISYQPQGQEALAGQVTGSMFSIPIDYNATNHAGEIVADCGLFTESRTESSMPSLSFTQKSRMPTKMEFQMTMMTVITHLRANPSIRMVAVTVRLTVMETVCPMRMTNVKGMTTIST